MTLNPFLCIDLSISDSLRSVRKSVLIYETIIDASEDEQTALIHKYFDHYSKSSDHTERVKRASWYR